MLHAEELLPQVICTLRQLVSCVCDLGKWGKCKQTSRSDPAVLTVFRSSNATMHTGCVGEAGGGRESDTKVGTALEVASLLAIVHAFSCMRAPALHVMSKV
eukprot:355500-Pelagomonas_calceolata.AAC.2